MPIAILLQVIVFWIQNLLQSEKLFHIFHGKTPLWNVILMLVLLICFTIKPK